MKASIGGPVFHGLSSEDLVVRYVASSIVRSSKGAHHFSKLEVLSDLPLLFELSARLADRLRNDVTAICVLASSGMAVGVATALVAEVILTFFHRAGFPRPESRGLGSRFRPDRRFSAKVAILDSHERSRYTSALCIEELKRYGSLQPVQVVVPFSFDTLIDPLNTHQEVDYSNVLNFSDAVHDIVKLRDDLTVEDLISLVENPRGSFWKYPPYDTLEQGYSEFNVPGITQRPRWFLGRGTNMAIVKPVSSELVNLCRHVNPTDDGIWDFFLDPAFVRQFSLQAGSVLGIEHYDHIVGVGHLGTAVAIALAYHNQDRFRGTIIAHFGDYGLIPYPKDLKNKRVLPIEMRLKTGAYAVDVFARLTGLGAEVREFVSVFSPLKPRSIFELSRQTSIRRLSDCGVEFLSLA
jgi:hypothetical protein